ncbi:hypothetical protein [Streptomyces sp. NPDC002913]
MNTDTSIAELLRAGLSNHAVARQLHVHTRRVRRVRFELDLPVHKPGPAPSNPQARFWEHAIPTADGHLEWPNHELRIRLGHEGPRERAGRIAFRIGNQRDPVGRVTPNCGHPRCVHPDHVEDQPMRDQYTAIFGEEAA